MHSPDRFELLAGILLMIPGIVATILIEEIPAQALINPSIIAAGIIGALWDVDLLPLGLALLYFLYFVGVVAVIVSLVSLVRRRRSVN